MRERGERAGRDSAEKHEREERERGEICERGERARGFGGRTVNQDELKFQVRSYGSLPVCEMQPTVIHITAGFFENPAVIAFFLTNWQ